MVLAEDDGGPGECQHEKQRRRETLEKKEEHERRARRKAAREAWHRRAKQRSGSDQSSCGEFDSSDSDPDEECRFFR